MKKKAANIIDVSQWYTTHGRTELPWRTTDDPYHVYISEVMLQQTQVKTVLERYYFQFLKRFPSLQALADAPQDDVLKMWEGLGYYNRARNLHKAAQQAAPALPNTIEELISLPGIGKNTAHAIACFAFGQAVPIMEANVKRILYRLFAKESASDNELWAFADQILNKHDSFTHNQALMDIGSTICTPKAPLCSSCPLFEHCSGRGSPELYPAPKAKKTVPTREKTIIIMMQPDGRVSMTPRTTRFLGGLYGFIELDTSDFKKEQSLKFKKLNIVKNKLFLLGGVTQTYSHFKLDAELYLYAPTSHISINTQWHTMQQLSKLAKSRADEKAVLLLEHHLQSS